MKLEAIWSKDSGSNEESDLSIDTSYDLENIADQLNMTESRSKPMYTLQEEIHRDFLSCYSEGENDEKQESCTGSKNRLLKREQRRREAVESLTEIANEIDKNAKSKTAEKNQDQMKLWKDSALLFPH